MFAGPLVTMALVTTNCVCRPPSYHALSYQKMCLQANTVLPDQDTVADLANASHLLLDFEHPPISCERQSSITWLGASPHMFCMVLNILT